MSKKVDIVFSDTWLSMDAEGINDVLSTTIDDFVKEGDQIINIEKHTDESGSSRFWIYILRNISMRIRRTDP